MSKSKKKIIDKSQWKEYDYHLPVLLNESISYLITDKNGTYIDGTLGGGGHAAKIMQNINSGGNLFAFDKDTFAIERAKTLFVEELKNPSPRLVLFNQSFATASNVCKERAINPHGILLDLGVSSQQLDTDQRGISYRVNSPLDMRFSNSSALTARDILNTYTESDLIQIFNDYGEEPRSYHIAKKIIEYRQRKQLETTFDLKQIIEECTPKILHFKTLSRIFQALRIKVNNELEELNNALTDIINVLAAGGRIVVISYHSLEDRIVKDIFKKNSTKIKINKYADETPAFLPTLKILTPKPIFPPDNEILQNPRSRSAKLRVAEKTKN